MNKLLSLTCTAMVLASSAAFAAEPATDTAAPIKHETTKHKHMKKHITHKTEATDQTSK